MKYKYFIPIYGFYVLIYDVYFNYENSELNKYYGENLGLILVLYLIIIYPLIILLTTL